MPKKIILFLTLFICLVFAKHSFAKTRQRAFQFKGHYVPVNTYVFTDKSNVTKLKPVIGNNVKQTSIAGALTNLARLINNNKIKSVKYKPEKFIISGFAFNSYKLNKTLRAKLKRVASLINKKGLIVKSITGYTDHFGTKAYNNKLALERAKSAERYLALKNIKLKGYGKCCYISKINIKDRRVVIYGLEKF